MLFAMRDDSAAHSFPRYRQTDRRTISINKSQSPSARLSHLRDACTDITDASHLRYTVPWHTEALLI